MLSSNSSKEFLPTTLLNDEVEPRRLKMVKPNDLMEQHI
jgi:predicted RNA-binding protein